MDKNEMYEGVADFIKNRIVLFDYYGSEAAQHSFNKDLLKDILGDTFRIVEREINGSIAGTLETPNLHISYFIEPKL